MNILAHLYFSKQINDVMVGNFIGDAVKGKQYKNYSKSIQEGILLHRKIDHLTDVHPITIESKRIFKSSYNLHAGVVIDLLYDHFLTVHWKKYHQLPLEEYLINVYNYLYKKIWLMPPKMQRMTPYIIQNNWLIQYNTLPGIKRVLNGMAKYTSMPAKAESAMFGIEENYSYLEFNFLSFFKDIQQTLDF